MKKLIILLALMGGSFTVSAQLLSYYSFEDSNGPTMAPAFVSTNTSASLLSAVNVDWPGHVVGISGLAPFFYDWPTTPQTVDSTKYIELTLTADSGRTISVDSLRFWVKMSGDNHPQYFYLRSSVDSYGSDLFSTYQPLGGWVLCQINNLDITIADGSSVTFRFYAGGAEEDTISPEDNGIALDQVYIYGLGDYETAVTPIHTVGLEKPLYPNPASVGEMVHIPKDSQVIDMTGRNVWAEDGMFVPQHSGLYVVGKQRLVVE